MSRLLGSKAHQKVALVLQYLADMLRYFVFFLLWLLPTLGFAEYKSGKDLYSAIQGIGHSHDDWFEDAYYTNLIRSDIKQENGQFLDVPLDHDKPTLVIFDGGPGGSSHRSTHPELHSIANVLRFDGRGIAFSRPAREEDYLNINFYTSQNTAKDANEILKSLGINKFSIVGFSAGAVPAFELARLRSDVRSVILHGPANPETSVEFMHKKILGLTKVIADQLPELWPFFEAASAFSPDGTQWLPTLIHWQLMRDGNLGLEAAVKTLHDMAKSWKEGTPIATIFENDDISRYRNSIESLYDEELMFDRFVNAVLFKKEYNGIGQIESHWKNGKVKIDKPFKPYFSREVEQRTVGVVNRISDAYTRAGRMPERVYMVSGVEDVQTTAEATQQIYDTMNVDQKTLIIIRGAGHCDSGFDCHRRPLSKWNYKAVQNIWRKMIYGKPISVVDTGFFNLVSEKKMSCVSYLERPR